MKASILLLLALVALAIGGCKRASYEDCEKLCMRFKELSALAELEEKSAGKSPEEVARLRAEHDQAWAEVVAREDDPGKENCILDCRRGGDDEQIACVAAAETYEVARACIKK